MSKIIVGGTYSDFACEEFNRIFRKEDPIFTEARHNIFNYIREALESAVNKDINKNEEV